MATGNQPPPPPLPRTHTHTHTHTHPGYASEHRKIFKKGKLSCQHLVYCLTDQHISQLCLELPTFQISEAERQSLRLRIAGAGAEATRLQITTGVSAVSTFKRSFLNHISHGESKLQCPWLCRLFAYDGSVCGHRPLVRLRTGRQAKNHQGISARGPSNEHLASRCLAASVVSIRYYTSRSAVGDLHVWGSVLCAHIVLLYHLFCRGYCLCANVPSHKSYMC